MVSDDGVLPNGTEGQNDSTGHVSLVWENVDCILSKEKLKTLSDAWNVDQQQKHQDMRSGSSDAGTNTSKHRSFIRRTSTPGADDFDWMRKPILRVDIPSIEEICDWSFDPLTFEGTVLVEVFVLMLEHYNLLEELKLDRDILVRYATAVKQMHHQDCYYQQIDIEDNENLNEMRQYDQQTVICEYHNWYHAVSCAHACFLFLFIGKTDHYLESKDIFCIIMGGLIHDLDHPGTNNDFEVKRGSELARRYDNDAVLERHSINQGLALCKENPALDWLNSFGTDEDRQYIEHFITESVLATDPARHGQVLKEALAFIEEGPKSYDGTNLTFFDNKNPEHRLFIGRLFLHSADISNPIHTSFEVARDWAIRVTAEFSRQASKERELKLPVTSFMDGLDNEYHIAKIQISFFGFMVQPLYHAIGKLFPSLNHLNSWGQRNCEKYKEIIRAFESKQRGEDIKQKSK